MHFSSGVDTNRTATGSYHLHPFGTRLIEGFFGGRLAHELEASGPGAFFDFAVAELVELFGSGIRARLRLLVETGWGRDPFARGSYSYARPGHADARAALAAPLDGRVFFAGEACSPHDFTTAHGVEPAAAAADTSAAAGGAVSAAKRMRRVQKIHRPRLLKDPAPRLGCAPPGRCG